MLPDIERYRHHLDGMSLTEAQKSELIQTLWSMLESFVDRSFEGDQAVSLNYGEDTEHGGELGCLVPDFDGAIFSSEWKEALWARFFTGAPPRQRRSVERYNIVKRA